MRFSKCDDCLFFSCWFGMSFFFNDMFDIPKQALVMETAPDWAVCMEKLLREVPWSLLYSWDI